MMNHGYRMKMKNYYSLDESTNGEKWYYLSDVIVTLSGIFMDVCFGLFSYTLYTI